MPLKIYCPNTQCCAAAEYTLDKPRFCSQCGSPFNASISTATAKNKTIAKENKTTNPVQIEENHDTETEIDVGDVKFEGQIESFGNNKGITFDQLSQQPKTGFTREKPKKVNKKKEIETFRIEASRPARVEVADGGPE